MAFRKEYKIKWDTSGDSTMSLSDRILTEQIRHDYNAHRYEPGEESLLETFARARSEEKKKSTATLFKPSNTSAGPKPADPTASNSNGRRKSF